MLPVPADEDLLVAGEGVLPIGHPVGRLTDVGGLEGEGEVVAHLRPVDEGVRMVDAVLVTQGVKLLLVDQGVDKLPAHRGGQAVWGELVLVLRGQLHIAVPAADDQDGLVRKLPGHLGHVLPEGGRVLVVRAHPVVDDGGAIGRAGGKLAIAHRAHPIGLMEGPGHAVHVDVAPKEQGLEVVFHRMFRFLLSFIPGKRGALGGSSWYSLVWDLLSMVGPACPAGVLCHR